MSPAEVIERAAEEGVLLALSASGRILAKGNQSVIDRWLPALQQSKAAIIAALKGRLCRSRVFSMLRDNPNIRYAIEVVDPNTDPVVVSIGIRNVATFDMKIPKAYYDGFALLELIEKHTGIQMQKLESKPAVIPFDTHEIEVGYQPMRDVLQHCAGYRPDNSDTDQRTGSERWLGLANQTGDQI